MTNAILRGKPDAGNPHVRFDEGEVASAKPMRGSLLYIRKIMVGVLYAICATCANAMEIDLHGTWRLERTDDKSVACEIAVPGDVHTALHKAQLMPDPFFGQNEKKTQWVGRHDWTVSRTFEATDEVLKRKAIVLRLEDVDLFATIYVNGKEVGKTSDRYCRWEFDVKPYLKKGANELKGVFASTENALPAIKATYGNRQFQMSCSELAWIDSLSLVRKPACHRGWDWGLSQMVTGFCGPVKLLAYDDFKVDYVVCEQKFNDTFTKCDLSVRVDCTDTEGKAFTETKAIMIDNPPLWWPNGAGKQNFYTFTVDVRGRKITKRIGLRKIEVLNTADTDENGKPGARMAFRVNGRELFMKGANWIPCSAFDAEQTPERYRDLITSAAAANMNMIRVWGGGQFEKDAFYDTCDELGILIWHDFMFSCAVYPGDERFLGNLRAELKHQLRRLRDHASIAMWCGDNECVGALKWWNRSKEEADYHKKAFEARCKVMNECIAEYDPTRQFWPSSPCAGPGNYADNWHDDSFGDMHNWTVWHENKSFDNYYKYRPRFCSEFGYQSFSSRDVAETYCRPEDVKSGNPDFEWHQKNLGGNKRIIETMSRYFRAPKGMDAVLYLSQVQQSIAIKTAVEGWRAQRPRCMGTLYWQLNDNWPVASWSSVEYGGKWKHLHYHAKRFFAPLAVVGLPRDRIAVLNDTAADVKAKVIVEEWAFDGTEPLTSATLERTAKADSVDVFNAPECKLAGPRFRVLRLVTDRGEFLNDWMHGYYNECDLADAEVEAKVNGFTVTLSTDKPAFFVWANVKGVRGEFSDNSITLLPGRPVTIEFCPKEPITPDEFRKVLSLTHLRKTY